MCFISYISQEHSCSAHRDFELILAISSVIDIEALLKHATEGSLSVSADTHSCTLD